MTALLRCNHCSKEFKYDSERRRHEQSHFPQFQCKVCSKNFSFISALRRHEKQHERKSTVTCPECRRDFRDETLLKRHMNYAHAGSYTCSKCDTIFHSEPALRTHMKTHKLASERRYQCSFEGCTKKFNFAHHLKHHELTHTNSKQHYCKICGKGFIQSHHLKAHLKTHSSDSSLHCTFPDCNKKFATAYAKKRHVTKYHIKTDSGISSDSNSANDPLVPTFSKSSILNDDNVPSNSDLLSKIENELQATMFAADEDIAEHIAEDLSLPKTYNKEDISLNTTKDDIENEVNDCQLALGRCIMSEEGEKCVCKQIKNINDYSITQVGAEPANTNKVSDKATDCKARQCCGGSCGMQKINIVPSDDMPEMVYKTDGTVKIKEFLDEDVIKLDIERKTDNSVKDKNFLESKVPRALYENLDRNTNDAKFIPFNSCKDVLGNCIVSGNGTMGEGCLCARMAIDDQVNPQEIEDITPHPRGGLPLVI